MSTVIIISAEAHSALRSLAQPEYRETGIPLHDGTWWVPVEQETAMRIEQFAMDGETTSDTIIRIAATFRSGGKAH